MSKSRRRRLLVRTGENWSREGTSVRAYQRLDNGSLTVRTSTAPAVDVPQRSIGERMVLAAPSRLLTACLPWHRDAWRSFARLLIRHGIPCTVQGQDRPCVPQHSGRNADGAMAPLFWDDAGPWVALYPTTEEQCDAIRTHSGLIRLVQADAGAVPFQGQGSGPEKARKVRKYPDHGSLPHRDTAVQPWQHLYSRAAKQRERMHLSAVFSALDAARKRSQDACAALARIGFYDDSRTLLPLPTVG